MPLMAFKVNNTNLQYTVLGPLLLFIELLISDFVLCCLGAAAAQGSTHCVSRPVLQSVWLPPGGQKHPKYAGHQFPRAQVSIWFTTSLLTVSLLLATEISVLIESGLGRGPSDICAQWSWMLSSSFIPRPFYLELFFLQICMYSQGKMFPCYLNAQKNIV